MPGFICRATIVALTWVMMGVAVPSAGAASGLFDWLSSCGSDRATPVTWYYPVTSTYVTSATDCCEPTVCCDVPCPTLVMPPQRPSLWQRLFGCGGADEPSYRTNWTRIPVTSYRPAVTTDPILGGSVSVMQPCTTYLWQADRQRCGLLDRLCGRCDPAPMAVPCCPPSSVYGGLGCAGGAVRSGCCTESVPAQVPTPAMPSTTPAPYYAPTGPGSPSVLPGGAVPTVPPSLPPAASSPPAGGVFPRTPMPPAADRRPALKPADVVPDAPTLNEPVRPTPVAPPGAPAPEAGSVDPDAVVPLPSSGRLRLNGQRPSVSPVPDPDTAPAESEAEPHAPQLLNPRDQVAVLRADQRWSYSTITWPAPQVPTRACPDRRWDESGWHSVRP